MFQLVSEKNDYKRFRYVMGLWFQDVSNIKECQGCDCPYGYADS